MKQLTHSPKSCSFSHRQRRPLVLSQTHIRQNNYAPIPSATRNNCHALTRASSEGKRRLSHHWSSAFLCSHSAIMCHLTYHTFAQAPVHMSSQSFILCPQSNRHQMPVTRTELQFCSCSTKLRFLASSTNCQHPWHTRTIPIILPNNDFRREYKRIPGKV